jgi:hypothetical protein
MHLSIALPLPFHCLKVLYGTAFHLCATPHQTSTPSKANAYLLPSSYSVFALFVLNPILLTFIYLSTPHCPRNNPLPLSSLQTLKQHQASRYLRLQILRHGNRSRDYLFSCLHRWPDTARYLRSWLGCSPCHSAGAYAECWCGVVAEVSGLERRGDGER